MYIAVLPLLFTKGTHPAHREEAAQTETSLTAGIVCVCMCGHLCILVHVCAFVC